jgi:hydrogenase expression/formation protein HypE
LMAEAHKDERILLAHGGGGSLMRNLIEEIILKRLSNPVLALLEDSAVLPRLPEGEEAASGRLAFTTDSYVVKPLFFKGGDIGKLAVCGTVNDLAASGARPLWLTLSFIIEEGLSIDQLERIVDSISEVSRQAEVRVVAGDIKVVERGAADGLYINTSGIGVVGEGVNLSASLIEEGDKVLVSGPIGEHGIAVIAAREGMELDVEVESDVAPLGGLVRDMLDSSPGVHFLRDPTRGGLAAVLNEAAATAGLTIRLFEEKIPLKPSVKAVSEMLGLAPLTLACEGRMAAIVEGKEAGKILKRMHQSPLGKEASIIGEVAKLLTARVILETKVGGRRIVDMPYGEEFPRIC